MPSTQKFNRYCGCSCGQQRLARGSTPSYPVHGLGSQLWLSRSLTVSPGPYYQTIKLNESHPASSVHVGGAWLLLYGRVNWGLAWEHICHKSYQQGRGTTKPLCLLAFSIALKWRSSASVLLSSLGRNHSDPSLLSIHEPYSQHCPPWYPEGQSLTAEVIAAHTPTPSLSVLAFSHLIWLSS